MKDRMHPFPMMMLVLTACSAPAPVEVTREVTRIVEQTVVVTPAPPNATPRKVWTYQDMVMGLIAFGEESDWRTANISSFKETANELGIKKLGVYHACCAQRNQIAAFHKLIADEEVNVIVLLPVVADGWDDSLREAREAGKIVILEDRSVSALKDLYTTWVGSDFIEEGRKAGRAMIELLKDSPKKNVVVLIGTVGSMGAKQRTQGFREVIEGSGIVITRSQTADFIRQEGKQVMETFLKESRDIQGVFANNDEMALGAIEAIREAGLKPGVDIQIVSIDATRAAFEAMRTGELSATVECNPLLGPQVYEAALRALNGEVLPKFIPADETVFHATDANLAEIFKTRKY